LIDAKKEKYNKRLYNLSIDDMKFPLVSIIVLNYNGKEIIRSCLNSILRSDYSNFEVILVDNGSTDDSIEQVEKLFGLDFRVKIVRNDRNLGYCEGNNIGIHYAKGEIIVFLNNDTEVDVDWLKEVMIMFIRDSTIGAAQPKLLNYYFPEKIDSLGGFINLYGFTSGGNLNINDMPSLEPHEIFFAVGSAMFVRKKVLNEIGIFDPYYFMFCEDVDLSWRIRLKGYKIILIPKSIVYHRISFTAEKASSIRISWYIRKNRLTTLIKNYEISNLIKALPILVTIYIANFIREILKRDIKKAITNITSILYNLKNFRRIFYERIIIQRNIRRIRDDKILKLISPRLLWK